MSTYVSLLTVFTTSYWELRILMSLFHLKSVSRLVTWIWKQTQNFVVWLYCPSSVGVATREVIICVRMRIRVRITWVLVCNCAVGYFVGFLFPRCVSQCCAWCWVSLPWPTVRFRHLAVSRSSVCAGCFASISSFFVLFHVFLWGRIRTFRKHVCSTDVLKPSYFAVSPPLWSGRVFVVCVHADSLLNSTFVLAGSSFLYVLFHVYSETKEEDLQWRANFTTMPSNSAQL